MSTLEDVVERALSGLGLELETVQRRSAGSRMLVNIVIDGDGVGGSGLTLDEVAAASKVVGAALDETDVMGEQPYVLEVGTRGVERPLTKPAHWRRNVGRLVKITDQAGQSLIDRIAGNDDDAVVLDGGQQIPFTDIKQARVQVEMRSISDEEEE
ncbi:MAG: ribosome maturation factor RimP [Propionibacteriaceae bacterium]|nr:ribosome maturation factor RimP [Propionibacteriaceae bacterium]